jgi:K+-sensing histidine kinase KdpD
LAADAATGLVVQSDVELEAAWGLPGDLKGLPVQSLFDQETAREAVLRHTVSEFVFTAVHDLNSPMRQAGLLAALLRDELGKACPPSCADLLNNMELAARKGTQLTQRLKEYAEAVTARPAIADRADLGEVAGQAIVASALGDHAVVCVDMQSGKVLVKCDPNLTRSAIKELLENTIRFGSEAALEVRLEARRVGPRWELAVSDNGRGVDPEDAPRLFRPFRRMHAEDVSGSGFGLAIAMALLTLQDGTLRLDTAYTGGARFVLALPAA